MEGDMTQLKARDNCGLDQHLYSSDKSQPKNNNNRKVSLYESNFDSYKKPTNFVINTRKIYPIGRFDFGQKVEFKIDRYGDKISDMLLELTLPTLPNVGYVNTIGYSLIDYVELEIGGHIIVKHYGMWMDIHDKLMMKPDFRDGVNEMVLRFDSHTDQSFRGGTVIVPLKFWFCDALNQSFPLIALSHNDITVRVKIRPLSQLWMSDSGATLTSGTYTISTGYLLVDYIRLDSAERDYLYKKKRHTYLIKQVQMLDFPVNANAKNIRIQLDSFNYPVTEIVWVFRNDSNEVAKDWFNYASTSTTADDPMLSAKITISEKDRLEEMSARFFRMIQPFKRHSNIPSDYIYMYSFAAKPELEGQPTGSCNFSMLDDVYLHTTMKDSYSQGKVFIFAVNYNVLIIEDGYAWLEKCVAP